MTKPLLMPHKIEVKADQVQVAGMDTSSIKAAMEEGVIIGIGADVSLPLKVGDKIKFKSFGVDVYNDGTTIIDERTISIGKRI
jgi:hypothetical protein